MKTDLFQCCGQYWVFQICWHIECSTFTASSFRIWNSSTEIPYPPLGLSAVMLPKAHLTSYTRMSGSRWVITPSWLSGSWRSFLCGLLCILATFSDYLLLLLVHTISVLYCAHLCMKCSFGISNVLEEISSLSHSCIPLHWSLREAFLSLLAILWNSAFKRVYLSFSPLPLGSLLFPAICKASSDTHFAFFFSFAFPFLGNGPDHFLLYNVTKLHS